MARNSGQQTDGDGWQTSVGDLARAIASRHIGIAQRVSARAASPLRAVSVGAIPAAIALARKLSGKAGWSRSLAERVSGLSYSISRSLQPGEFQGERSATVLASRRRGMRLELEEETPSLFSRYEEISFGSREDSGPSAVARAQHDDEPGPVQPPVPSTRYSAEPAGSALSRGPVAHDGRTTPSRAITTPPASPRDPGQGPPHPDTPVSRKPQGPDFRPAESHPGEPERGLSSIREVADQREGSPDAGRVDHRFEPAGEVPAPPPLESAESRSEVPPDMPVRRFAAPDEAAPSPVQPIVRPRQRPASLILRSPVALYHAISRRLMKPAISRSEIPRPHASVPDEPAPREVHAPRQEERSQAGQEAPPTPSEGAFQQAPGEPRAVDTGGPVAAAPSTEPVGTPGRSPTGRPQASRSLAETVLARHQPPAIARLTPRALSRALSRALVQRSPKAGIKSRAPEAAAGAPSSVPLLGAVQGIERISTLVPSAADRPDVTFVAKWPELQPEVDSPATGAGQPPGRFALSGRTIPIPFVQRLAMPRSPEGDLPGSVSQGAHGVSREIARRYRLPIEHTRHPWTEDAFQAGALHLQPHFEAPEAEKEVRHPLAAASMVDAASAGVMALESGTFYPSPSLAGPARTLAQRAPATYEQPIVQAVPASLPSPTGGVDGGPGAYEPVEPVLARVRSIPSQEAAEGETAGMPVQRAEGEPTEQAESEETTGDVEALAREVYTIIRRRMAIERERAGCR